MDLFYLVGNYSGGVVLIHAVTVDPEAATNIHKLLIDNCIISCINTSVVIYSNQLLVVSRHEHTDNILMLNKIEAKEISKALVQPPMITIEYYAGSIKYYNSSWKELHDYTLRQILLIRYCIINTSQDEITPPLELLTF